MTNDSDRSDIILPDIPFDDDFQVREDVYNQLLEQIQSTTLDVREALASYSPQADEDQNDLIHTDAEVMRLLAPAGSGKTQTIVNRALVQMQAGVNPERLLILTFDRAAANAVTEKLAAQLEHQGVTERSPRISTLNAFGYGLLRELFPDEYKDVAEPKFQRRIIRAARKKLPSQDAARAASLPFGLSDSFYLGVLSVLKNELFDPRDFDPQEIADFLGSSRPLRVLFEDQPDPQTVHTRIEVVIWLFRQYEAGLSSARALDFDDQKLRSYERLKANPDVLKTVRRRFDEIVVDEFQDINKLDFELIRELGLESRLLVVGDDDQAIYGFRGCSPDYIINLQERIGRPVRSFELRRNYRNPRNIVRHSTDLIRHNKWRVDKHPIAVRQDDAKVKVVASQSAALEAELITRSIERIKKSAPSLGYEDFAVLYRTNAQSLPLQVSLILAEVPYYVRPEDHIVRNGLLLKLLAVLRLKLALGKGQEAQPSDIADFLQSFFHYLERDQLARLLTVLDQYPDLWSGLRSEAFLIANPRPQDGSPAASLRKVVDSGSLADVLDVLVTEFKGFYGVIGSLEDAVEDRLPLGEVYELALAFKGDVAAFVDMIEEAIRKASEHGVGQKKDEGVALLTYFKAKGLQWHTVFLTACNEGLIPHRRADVEDERRLFYVGMTRASSNLVVSYLALSCRNEVNASRFLYEARLLTEEVDTAA